MGFLYTRSKTADGFGAFAIKISVHAEVTASVV
jgi:hypothetical protein